MSNEEFWTLLDYALTRITLPTSTIYVGCHPDDADTPSCWAAVRENKILHLYARESVRSVPELAALMERTFLQDIEARVGHLTRTSYNPFKELQR